MYLKSLTLKGFKSFAQPTTFAFEPGVTAVVGPNGSGKSNVVDALAWVMGEQGAKSLRGGKMEDVIFAGTSSRGPLGRAEVSLTIDNSDGALPIEYTEVTISRTLFRNGTSEYAINGESCRLLDVQELLSDSGLGREMHVIVGQGRLDSVLQASPEDRRGFIEEAAGILKHRRRKDKTLRKLEAMETNLTRLSDLAGEIRRQLKPLGRQAEVAREAQTIAAHVRDARARLLADDVVTLRAALAEAAHTEHERGTERIVLTEQLEQKTLRLARLESQPGGEAVDEARQIVHALESVQERVRGLYTLANQRIALLGTELDIEEATATVTRSMIEDARAEAAEAAARVNAAEDALLAAQGVVRSKRNELDAVDAEVAAQSALVSQHDLELSALVGRADAAATKLAALQGEVERHEAALAEAMSRFTQAELHLSEVEAAGSEHTQSTELNAAYEAAGEALLDAETERDRLRDALHELERLRDSLQAQTRALSRALESNDGTSSILEHGIGGAKFRVSDAVRVSKGFEAAVTAALGSLADAVLVDSADRGLDVLDGAHGSELGRVDVVVADYEQPPFTWPSIAGLTPLSDVIEAPTGVLALLRTVAVVDSLAAARGALSALRDAGPITLVTRDGDVVSASRLQGGSGRGRGRIELRAERDAAQSELEQVERDAETTRAGLESARNRVAEAKERSTAALAALRAVDTELAAHTETLNRARATVEATAAEVERLRASGESSRQRLAEAETEAERTAAERDSAQARPRPILDVSTRDQVAAEWETAREAEVAARLELETARERVRAEDARVTALHERQAAEARAAEEAARRAVQRNRQREIAERVVAQLPELLASIDQSLATARVDLARAEAERSAHTEELVTLRREESALRDRLRELTESVHGLEMQMYEKKLHLSSLLERAGNELGLVEDVLVAEYGPEVALEDGTPFVRAEQERRLREYESKVEQLGRVNPLALEEYAALEQRHTFLTEQLADLTKTRADLMTIIEELDEKMQSIFLDAFEDTKAAFAEVFPILFPGGSGSISLTDPSNILTTGIDIAVKPAGKKIDRLSLLSGGERSLAAVALLVAIFKARPSPFYIMDEVEAALDDANLGRLLSIFEQLRESSQLIVITHQKRTMEIADALYGVSMRQDGVSAVVGQRVAAEVGA
ncbi:MAG TPA: chromosome segregation protein SMC [Microbacteriaceae bacterium]|nr:chromosome segregation protein SMC [Microbacteriaceae bacterium]